MWDWITRLFKTHHAAHNYLGPCHSKLMGPQRMTQINAKGMPGGGFISYIKNNLKKKKKKTPPTPSTVSSWEHVAISQHDHSCIIPFVSTATKIWQLFGKPPFVSHARSLAISGNAEVRAKVIHAFHGGDKWVTEQCYEITVNHQATLFLFNYSSTRKHRPTCRSML